MVDQNIIGAKEDAVKRLQAVVALSSAAGFSSSLVSPHECRVQGGILLAAVEVVLDQLLSAGLRIHRRMNQ